jgi:hypothetical protein
MTDSPPRPKRYMAYIQWNKKQGWYAGYIPGIGGSETVEGSMDALKAGLQNSLARRLADRKSRLQQGGGPRPGFRRIDLKA